MIVLRFKIQCRSDKADEVGAALMAVIEPAREVEGVVSFDIARDLADPNAFIAVEVFQDQAARDRQESLPQVGKVMALLPESLAAPPEMSVYEVASPVTA
jgi:quinol monooxygenase YgiN